MIFTVKGDLLTYNQDQENRVICHQCNCTTTRGFGLASAINKAFPYANIYSGKHKVDPINRNPGTIIARKSSNTTIINLLAQKYPSKPTIDDTKEVRLSYFKQCLENLGAWCKDNVIELVYMPYGIGCGLAGGNWADYEACIKAFSQTHNINVVLVQL